MDHERRAGTVQSRYLPRRSTRLIVAANQFIRFGERAAQVVSVRRNLAIRTPLITGFGSRRT